MEEEEIRRLSEVVGDETYNGGSVEEKRERKERGGGEREKSRTCNPISVRASRKAPLTGFGSHTAHTQHNSISVVNKVRDW